MPENPKKFQRSLRPWKAGDWVQVPETEGNGGLGDGNPVWSEVHSVTPHDVTVIDSAGEARTYSHLAVKAWRRGPGGQIIPVGIA